MMIIVAVICAIPGFIAATVNRFENRIAAFAVIIAGIGSLAAPYTFSNGNLLLAALPIPFYLLGALGFGWGATKTSEQLPAALSSLGFIFAVLFFAIVFIGLLGTANI